MEDDDLQRLYVWLDEIPLSRPKRSIARDFSDGVMVAEVVLHFIPKLVDMHNYTPANASKQKLNNWATLNRKVFNKLGLVVPENVIKGVVDMKPGVAEVVLSNLRQKVEQFLLRGDDEFEPSPPAPNVVVRSQAPASHFSPPPPAAVAAPAPSKQIAAPIAKPVAARSPPKQQQQSQHQGDQSKDISQTLMEKDQTLMDYQETVDILQVKVRKLEQLVQLKDKRIEELTKKLKQAGIKI